MSRETQGMAGGVLIMAGGTGGHIFPGLAVADALKDLDVPVRWLGASGGMECQRVPLCGIPLDTVDISGLRGKGIRTWFALPFRLLKAVSQAFGILGRNRPSCAVSFGGYAAGPGGLAAKLRGIPVLVHEQNRIPGMTNKFLARIAKKVLQAFPGTWPEARGVVTCGNPVREDVVNLPEPQDRLSGRSGPLRVLITGGSQGARTLNRVLPGVLGVVGEITSIQVRHQAGQRDLEETRALYEQQDLDADISAFIEDMASAYGWADLVICRSGALTVSELAAAGLGSVLVPFPFAVDDHQTRNAEFLAEAGAAIVVQESDLDAEEFSELLGELLADRQKLLDMARAARSVAIPDSARHVAQLCLEYAR